jgi:hypothetical protein
MSLRQTAKGKNKARPASDDEEDKPLPERLPEDPKTVQLRRRAEALLWILFAVGLAHWTGFYDAFMAQTGEYAVLSREQDIVLTLRMHILSDGRSLRVLAA